MPVRIEITQKPELLDAEGEALRKKAFDYFGIQTQSIRTINILTIDAQLNADEIERARTEIFTNPVSQVSSLKPLPLEFDWTIWIGYRPGVRDNAGATAIEAMQDLFGAALSVDAAAYTSKRYCLKGTNLNRRKVEKIASELLANDIIQQWKIFSIRDWNTEQGIGFILPKVSLDHQPTVTTIGIDSDETLRQLSNERNLALNPKDIPVIRDYFLDKAVQKQRSLEGLVDPTDVELEYISQARSDHCNHNTFQGLFHYQDYCTGENRKIDNLFKTCIKEPTLELQKRKNWVISVLWDNAGVGRFDDDHYYVITGETHNSPSNMEAYGGAITGIVGIYRDPMGTGKGSRLIMGGYGFCAGMRDYQGDLKPRLHPKRLLDGVIEGVRDGGNKSGVPTPFGQVLFHPGYMGKCLVFVSALGLMPSRVKGEPSEQKNILAGDLVIMAGGRVGKDGIHGVTASSEIFSEHTPAGHVQIGDPYTQKKMQDFLLEARDQALIRFITDNGGGGLSSSVGESALFSNGCEIDLDKVPLKYEGLDQWEIWVSESQERMTIAIDPENREPFFQLAAKHAVECTIIGRYTDTGKLHIKYNGTTCAFVDLDLLTKGFAQWEFDAVWKSPEDRGLIEPVLLPVRECNKHLLDMLSRPNICSKNWIARQYDHEVQGTSVIKPLIGKDRDIASDAAVIRPVLESNRGLAFAQSLLPFYSQIDAYHMTTCTIDEAVRRLIAVGGDPGHIGGVDNFCWPNIQFDPVDNPDGKFKAAQLVRSCEALRDMCLAYEIPLLSGKDSMYVDGHLPGRYGEVHKISALETLQFSTTSVISDVKSCVTLDAKMPGDLVYILGATANELGGSEYYDMFGYIGCNVPQVKPSQFLTLYRALFKAINQDLIASAHGIYRGGLGVHLAQVAMAGGLGLSINLESVPVEGGDELREDKLLYSESAGRFIVTVDSNQRRSFEKHFDRMPMACIGQVTSTDRFTVNGLNSTTIIDLSVPELKNAWHGPFGDMV
ncbi:MAG: phosphoribosylformylglycinamidine synthase [Desulfobacteraceae bacterium]|nr:phosphoribosylformylglycinamidine synthase [Desulfobacteraceae bacterium]